MHISNGDARSPQGNRESSHCCEITKLPQQRVKPPNISTAIAANKLQFQASHSSLYDFFLHEPKTSSGHRVIIIQARSHNKAERPEAKNDIS
jgi:hypothetical protein